MVMPSTPPALVSPLSNTFGCHTAVTCEGPSLRVWTIRVLSKREDAHTAEIRTLTRTLLWDNKEQPELKAVCEESAASSCAEPPKPRPIGIAIGSVLRRLVGRCIMEQIN